MTDGDDQGYKQIKSWTFWCTAVASKHACVQVHDEVIMEGPKESAERAQQLVVQHMEHPFNGQNPLRVALVVDSNVAENWYEAK